MNQEYATYILEKTKNDYNQIAEEFSSTRSRPWPEIQFLFDDNIKEGDKVLDLGCGNGRFFGTMRNKKIDYFGVDNSEKLIEIAKRRHPGVNFQAANGLKLPFPDNFFDVIFCLAVLHHLPSKELRLNFLAEAKRVLNPGGNLILTVWKLKSKRWLSLPFELYLVLKYICGRFLWGSELDYRDVFEWWGKKVKRYYHCFSQRELSELVGKSGFKILKAGLIRNERGNRNNIYLVGQKYFE